MKRKKKSKIKVDLNMTEYSELIRISRSIENLLHIEARNLIIADESIRLGWNKIVDAHIDFFEIIESFEPSEKTIENTMQEPWFKKAQVDKRKLN